MPSWGLRFAWLLPLLALATHSRGAGPDAEQAEFFEKRIRPVLVQNCFPCHAATAKELKGGLRLDTREGLRKGGVSGPVVIPGQPDQSLLLRALRYEGPRMPPPGKLPAAVVADFETWVRLGAVDPRTDAATGPKKTIDFTAARRHWA